MSAVLKATSQRTIELHESLAEIRSRIQSATSSSSSHSPPTLVAVSKYKPSSDILACFENGQRHFGENYVQELVDKAAELPSEIQWHFIGTLQSNKAKTLASIPNLHTIQTLTSTKTATLLNNTLPPTRSTPLNVFIQINTSGESAKSGLPPLTSSTLTPDLPKLAKHIITTCPRLQLQGLMTIGALEHSVSGGENADFERLKETRDSLRGMLERDPEVDAGMWEGRLLLSMGMSSDFEAALKAGSDIVRVGTGIFGARTKKGELVA